MSVIIRPQGNIGPFKTIETLADRLRCDGVDYPFTVLGQYTISNDDSQAPAPIPPPVTVPQSVPKWAALHALIDADLDTLPQTYFASLPAGKTRKKAEAKWQADPVLRRDSPILAAAIAAGAVTAAQVDSLMIAADAIARAA